MEPEPVRKVSTDYDEHDAPILGWGLKKSSPKIPSEGFNYGPVLLVGSDAVLTSCKCKLAGNIPSQLTVAKSQAQCTVEVDLVTAHRSSS